MLELIFIFGILFVGIVASYTDIKTGKIRNKTLIWGIIIAILTNMIIIAANIILKNPLNPKAYGDYFCNLVFMLLISYFLWKIGIWTAGDAKLFTVFNFLIPPIFIKYDYLGPFYGMVLFFNIFGLMLFYFLFLIVKKIKQIELKENLKKTFNIRNIVQIVWFIFAIQVIIGPISNIIPDNYFVNILIMFLLYSLIDAFVPEKEKNIIFIILSIVRLITDLKGVFTIGFVINIGITLVGLLILNFMVLRLGHYAFTKKVKLEKLEENMILAEYMVPETVRGKRKFRKEQLDLVTIFSYMKNDNFRNTLKNYDIKKGLTKRHIKYIKEHRKEFLFNEIKIYETMPFAQIIFAGVLITLLCKGNILLMAKDLFIKLIN